MICYRPGGLLGRKDRLINLLTGDIGINPRSSTPADRQNGRNTPFVVKIWAPSRYYVRVDIDRIGGVLNCNN